MALSLFSRAAASSSLPGALSIPASQNWDGNDGFWSSFPFSVGQPAQAVRLLPSTAADTIWVIAEDGACPSGIPVPAGTGPACSDSRGELFNQNASYSWIGNSLYSFATETYLGYDTNDSYGFDQIQLGFTGPTLQHQVISLMADPHYWLGGFGLNPLPSNFSNYNNPQNSSMASLLGNNNISSISYGYTAGAYYRLDHVFGSLTLGGYDAALYQPNDLSISMANNDGRDLVLGLRDVTTNATSSSLLPSGAIYSFIDSTLPFIWLPIDACKAFESAFGITYDPETELYLLNASAHDALLAQNPTITFTVGSGTSGGPTNNITFPYAAFDLNISYPWIPQNQTTTRYFPLRQAQNDTQYTLGRTFLQEAYLTADYDRANFSVAQRPWTQQAINNPQITAIYPPGVETGSSGLSGGAIAGIVVGVVAALAIAIGLGLFFFLRRRKQQRWQRDEAEKAALAAKERQVEDASQSSGDRQSRVTNSTFDGVPTADAKLATLSMATDPRAGGQQTYELGSPRQIHEAPNAADGEGGKAPHSELAGSSAQAWEADSAARFELPGSQVPISMSEKLGGARLVGWDGRTASNGSSSPTRILSRGPPRNSNSSSPSPQHAPGEGTF